MITTGMASYPQSRIFLSPSRLEITLNVSRKPRGLGLPVTIKVNSSYPNIATHPLELYISILASFEEVEYGHCVVVEVLVMRPNMYSRPKSKYEMDDGNG